MPALDQDMALPCASVMVTIVLLKVAATCATPTTTFFFSFLRGRPPAFLSATAIGLLRHFLLAGDRFGRAFAGAGVGVSTLTADRQALTVTQAAIATQVHQTLDVHRHIAAQIALNQIVAVDDFADLDGFGFRQIANATGRIDAQLRDDLLGSVQPDSMNVGESNLDSLLGRDVNAGDTCHW